MSTYHDMDDSRDDKELRDRLSENEKELLELQIEFVRSIPEWVPDPANHNQILRVLASLPPVFFMQKDLQKLLTAAVGSLPTDLLNRYLTSLSGASADEEASVAARLSGIDKKYAHNLNQLFKVELSKLGPNGYKGGLLDGHDLDDLQHHDKPPMALGSRRVDSSTTSAGYKNLENLKQRYKSHSSETFERFVKTTALHFEAFMQAIANEKSLEGLWSDEFPTLGGEYARIRSGKIPKALSESLYTIFTDACSKASFEIFQACQSPKI